MSVDSKIVEMKFENRQFESGVRQSLDSINALNKGMRFDGAGRGVADLNKAIMGVDMSRISAGVDNVSSKFSALGAIAFTALQRITNASIDAGKRIGSALTIDPAKAGFAEYETGLNSVQTILSNTAAAGTTLKDVNRTLDELNEYADQTIYNFSEMTKNIGTFTAAGVDLETASGSIKGIANLAALSGSNANQASNAMYQLSQAISSGKVSLQDWSSVVTSGMGGTVFQRALAQTAVAMGTLDEKALKLTGKMKNVKIDGQSFRESITARPGEESWLTSGVLTATLQQLSGDLSDADLKAQGFTKSQIKAIQKQAAAAKEAATIVKTGTQLVGVLQEAAGSGWALTWRTVVGDFEEAKKLWTGVSNELTGIIGRQAAARNKMFEDWKAAGGRTAAIDAIKAAWQGLLQIAKPIQEAFREIFPRTTGKQLADITKNIRDFFQGFKLGEQTIENLKSTFRGFFAIFGIAWEVIKQVASALGDLFGSMDGEDNFIRITASIGDFIYGIYETIKAGGKFAETLKVITNWLKVPLVFIKNLIAGFADFVESMNIGNAPDGLVSKFKPFSALAEIISSAWGHVMDVIKKVTGAFGKLGGSSADFFRGFGEGLVNFFQNIDVNALIAAINTGIFAALVLAIKKFFQDLSSVTEEATGFIKSLTAPLDGLTGTLEEMQNTLKAAQLLAIAGAIAVLAWGLVQLSKVEEDGLKAAVGAMAALFIQLGVTMAVLQKITIGGGFANLVLLAAAVSILADAVSKLAAIDFINLLKGLWATASLLYLLVGAAKAMPDGKKMISSSAGLILMAVAVSVLAEAVAVLAELSLEELGRGLLGVGGILAALVLFTKFQAANKGGAVQAAGLLLLSFGIKNLAESVAEMAKLGWEEIGRGLAGLAGGLLIMGAALKFVPPSSILSAAAIFIAASALKMVGEAVASMGNLEWGEIGRGLTVLGGALTIMGLALGLMPPTSVLSAAALLIAAQAVGKLGEAVGNMGQMDWGQIGRAMVVLGGSLLIIALGVTAMSGALAGAAALTIVVAALALFVPVLLLLGNMEWEEIGKGLAALAGVFVVLGLAGLILTPVVPTLLALGAALLLLGAGMALAGAGLLLVGAGITSIAVAAAAGTASIVTFITGLASTIPVVFEQFGRGIVMMITTIASQSVAIVDGFTKIFSAVLKSIERVIPKMIQVATKIIITLAYALVALIPRLADAGYRMITGLLKALAANVPKMAAAAVDLITAFIRAIGREAPRLADAAAKALIDFLNGLAQAIRDNAEALGQAGNNIGVAIVEGMVLGIKGGLTNVIEAAKGLASSALQAAKNFLGIKSPSREFAKLGKFSAQGYAKGLKGDRSSINAAQRYMNEQLRGAMRAAKEDIKDLEEKLEKLNSARNKDTQAIKKTTAALKQARLEYARTSAAIKVSNTFDDETRRLKSLADKLDKVGTKLQKAEQKLADAKKVRDDYNKSIRDQYSDLPDITAETKLPDYISGIQKQIADTQIFTAQLVKLREMGLNDELYKDLLSKGTAAIPFATQLLEGGQASVDEINTLGSSLAESAKTLGSNASTALYQAAVDAAAGIVKGLESQQAEIEKQMDKIADYMVNAIKRKLGIKSPSRVFAEIGRWTNEGLALGLKDSSATVDAAESVGLNAIEAMRKTLSGMQDTIMSDVDVNPTIRPVLDLTDVEKNARNLGSILSARPLEVGAAYSAASDASKGYTANQRAAFERSVPVPGANVSLTQNNYSPKALPPAEIYRQTKNQLSVAKEALSHS